MTAIEKHAYFAYVFTNERDAYYNAYVPHTVYSDEQWALRAGRERPPYVMLDNIRGVPEIGKRVECWPSRNSTMWTEVNHLTPIGKFSLDENYKLEGSCTLIHLDKDEKNLKASDLMVRAHSIYLKYLEIQASGLESDKKESESTKQEPKKAHSNWCCQIL